MSARTGGHIPALRPLLDALVKEGFSIDQPLHERALSAVGEAPR